jgi:hypothetical protein
LNCGLSLCVRTTRPTHTFRTTDSSACRVETGRPCCCFTQIQRWRSDEGYWTLEEGRALVLEELKNGGRMRHPNLLPVDCAWTRKISVNRRLNPKDRTDAWLRATLHIPANIRRCSLCRHDVELFSKVSRQASTGGPVTAIQQCGSEFLQ